MRIAVGSTKGGSGKSTVATHLAVGMALRGHRVGLVDLDRQGCVTGWLAARPDTAAPIVEVDADEMGKAQRRLDALILDLPAGLRRERFEDALEDVDAVVVPAMPSFFDELGTQHVMERLTAFKPVRKGRCEVLTVALRVRAGARSAARLTAFLCGLRLGPEDRRLSPYAPAATIRESQAYVDAAARGLTVLELPARLGGRFAPDWGPLVTRLASMRHERAT